MADQASFFIKNKFANDNLRVTRQLWQSESDLDVTVAGNSGETILIPNPDVVLVIETPSKEDTKDCYMRVNSSVDMTISYSRSKSKWILKLDSNDLPSDVPTDANVEVGENVPG